MPSVCAQVLLLSLLSVAVNSLSSTTSARMKQQVINLIRGFSMEITPASFLKTPGIISSQRSLLPAGTSVAITSLPGSYFGDTVACAKVLKEYGYKPIPHLAARSIQDHSMLEDRLRQMKETQIEEIILIAGSDSNKDSAQYAFSSSIDILSTGLLEQYGIRRIGVAGHPEGHSQISNKELWDAIGWKYEYNKRPDTADLYFVTQFCFDAEPIISWDKALQKLFGDDEKKAMPIRVGIPGVASITTLLKYAHDCGAGPSLQILHQSSSATKRNLLTHQTPDKLLRDLATYCATSEDTWIDGIHVYPFGGLQRSATWFNAVVQGQFYIGHDETE